MSFVFIVVGLAVTGCKQLLPHPVEAKAGAWVMEVQKLRDGPDTFVINRPGRRVVYRPDRGTHFLWAVVKLTNTTPQRRRFSWNLCDLDSPDGAILPSLVTAHSALNIPKPELEVIEPQETIVRRLAFSYPKDRTPHRLKCKKLYVRLAL